MQANKDNVLDCNTVLNNTPHLDDLNVILKQTKTKGVGLFSINPIKKDEIVAYYKLKVYRTKTF